MVALQGQFGFELNATVIDDTEAATISHYVALYKEHREWISESTTWRIDSAVEHLLMQGLVSNDKTRSLWFVVTEASLPTTCPGRLLPRGLQADKTYAVTLVSDNLDQLAHYSKKLPEWLNAPCKVSGELLMKLGVTLPVMPAQTALLLDISSID